MSDPLIAVRAIHFASTLIVVGTVLFCTLVAEPILKRLEAPFEWVRPYRKRMELLLWINLFTAIASAALWLVLLAASVVDLPWIDAITDGTAWSLLTETQFGLVWETRLLFAAALVGLFLLSPWIVDRWSSWHRLLTTLTAAFFLVPLAWAGHAGATSGSDRWVHVLADALHLLAASAWIGGLIPLLLFLTPTRPSQVADGQWLAACCQILRRFSKLGVMSVGVLLVSGIINTWFLTDRMRGLVGTDYGQLLLIKIALFLAMLCFAADNRLRLLPRLSHGDDPTDLNRDVQTLRQLRRNTVLEIALGLSVIYVVGILGMTPPAGHHESLSGAVEAGEYSAGPIKISQVWSRVVAKVVPSAGGYMTLTNTGTEADTLISGTVAIAGKVEVQRMTMTGGIMRMRRLDAGLTIKPGETVVLDPSGYHLMFLELTERPELGVPIKGTLVFEKAGEVDIEYQVEPVGTQVPGRGAKQGGMPHYERH